MQFFRPSKPAAGNPQPDLTDIDLEASAATFVTSTTATTATTAATAATATALTTTTISTAATTVPTMEDFESSTAKIEAALQQADRILPSADRQQKLLLPPPSSLKQTAPTPKMPTAPPQAIIPAGDLARVEEHVAFARAAVKRLVDQNRMLTPSSKHAAATPIVGPSTRAIRATRTRKLASDLASTVSRLASARDAARAAAEASLRRDIRAVSPHALQAHGTAAATTTTESGDGAFADGVLDAIPKAGLERERLQLSDLKRRNDELRMLANGVADLREAFGDLALYVDEQQDVLNEVEVAIGETKSVQKMTAEKELVQVVTYKRRVRRMQMCCAGSVVVLVVVIVLVIVLVLR